MKKTLSLEEITGIIKAGRDSGVSVMKFGDFYVKYGRISPMESPEDVSVTSPAAEIAEQQTEIAKDELVAEELRTRDEQIAHMLVDNPQLAEELLVQGELEQDDGPVEED